MIRLQITGRHYELDEKIVSYVNKKLGGLDKYLPRHKDATIGSVVLTKDHSNRQDNEFCCEAILDVPGERMQAKEATMNMYAAVDIVEQKLKVQVLKYKDRTEPAKNRRRMLFGKMFSRDRATNPEIVEETETGQA